MTSIWILGLLIMISALPVAAVYIWFRRSRFPLDQIWFFLSLLCGAASLLIALFLQNGVPSGSGTGIGFILFHVLIRIALTEEAARFLSLLLLFHLAGRLRYGPIASDAAGKSVAWGAATGLLAGLGFAVIETASYSAIDMNIALLRAFTSAPLHGACASRVGVSALTGRTEPVRGVLYFVFAVIVHGAYNFMVITRTPAIVPVLLALTAFASALRLIRSP